MNIAINKLVQFTEWPQTDLVISTRLFRQG